ncbi:MAG TPA: heavy metal-responsive transcriptional regulator [Thermoanaerobaculia bacterium]|nr:heavy metal-responsive transcriptional regulator [Thermoanaerobaculia bacterium]
MNDKTMLIGEVARACGVSADTIRHYERRGVIPPAERDAGGYRRYSPAVIDRVRIIRRSLSLGFSLDELGRFFRDRAAGSPPCRQVRALGEKKLQQIDARLAELTELREVLASIIEQWDHRLALTDAGEPAHLLDSLDTNGGYTS